MSPDVRLVAKAYIDRGWAVVPLVKGSKRASTRWQTTTYEPKQFKDGDGIAMKCGEPSGWLVDVDLDSKEAVAAAELLLPSTALMHGRPGKPKSHYWYRCEGAKTIQFTDVKDNSTGKNNMLVELRSTGGYTAVPPSEHPSGEHHEWATESDPLTVGFDELLIGVRSVAIAALVARHYPGPGARHSLAGPLAGFLLQAGVPSPMVMAIIEAVAKTAHDTDVQDRVKFAAGTCAKHKRGENVTGGPMLAEAIGEDVVAKLRAWLRQADDGAIEEMNRRHFFTRIGAKSAIGREDDPSGVVVFQPVRELYSEYQNRRVQVGVDKDGEPVYKPLFETWLSSPRRREYLGGVVMAAHPRKAPENACNLWKGLAIEPAPGDCSRFLAHLRDVVCSGNAEHYEYLLKWSAFAVQQPGTPPGVAIVLRGKPGTGKGTFVRMFERIYGKRHCAHLDRSKDLVDFNALIAGKVLVFADEAFFAGDKQNLGALKRIITEPTIRISRKHIDSHEEDNNLHVIMATNEDWAVHAQPGERRFFAVDVSDIHQDEREYFDLLYKEMENGGAAAFLHMLNEMTVTAAEIRDCPKTEALRAQQNQSLSPHLMWWQECLYEGVIGMLEPTKTWGKWQPTDVIYDAHLAWCRNRPFARPLGKIEFGKQMSLYLTARTGSPATVPKTVGGKRGVRCWELRDLHEARDVFDGQLRTRGEWPDAPSDARRSCPF